jgi:hypothetical protein
MDQLIILALENHRIINGNYVVNYNKKNINVYNKPLYICFKISKKLYLIDNENLLGKH